MTRASVKRIAVNAAVLCTAVAVGLLGANILTEGGASTFDSIQYWWNYQQKVRVKGKARCIRSGAFLSSGETAAPDGSVRKNECWVQLDAGNYRKTVKTSKDGTYAFTNVPRVRGAEIRIVNAVHHHTHDGVDKEVRYPASVSQRIRISQEETLLGFVKPRKDRGEWVMGPTLWGGRRLYVHGGQ